MIAFTHQQQLRERACMLRYTHISCLVYNCDGVFTARYELTVIYNTDYF
jgi:hypothetical protein